MPSLIIQARVPWRRLTRSKPDRMPQPQMKLADLLAAQSLHWRESQTHHPLTLWDLEQIMAKKVSSPLRDWGMMATEVTVARRKVQERQAGGCARCTAGLGVEYKNSITC